MTIALGFHLRRDDAIVLGADRQITMAASHKYQEDKTTIIWGEGWRVAFVYAGIPDQMNALRDRVSELLEGQIPTRKDVKTILEGSLSELQQKHRKDFLLQTLCAVSVPDGLALLKSDGKLVVQTQSEYLGVGDSSLIRYLDSMFHPSFLTIPQAIACVTYIIGQANAYIDGCFGGPDIVLLSQSAWLRVAGSDDLAKLEGQMSNLLWVPEQWLDRHLGEFSEKVREFRKQKEFKWP